MKASTIPPILLLTILLAPLWSSPSHAVPQIMNYQGRLTHPIDGSPLDTPVMLTFTFYNQSEGGTALPGFSDTKEVQPSPEGIFSAAIGQTGMLIPASFFDSSDLYLNIDVDGVPVSPRLRILSTGFSIRALRADSSVTADTAAELDGNLINGFDSTNSGRLEIRSSTGNEIASIGTTSEGNGLVTVSREGNPLAQAKLGAFTHTLNSNNVIYQGGFVALTDNTALETVSIRAHKENPSGSSTPGHGGEILLRNSLGDATVQIAGNDTQHQNGAIAITTSSGLSAVRVATEPGDNNGHGQILLYANAPPNTPRITLNGGSGSITAVGTIMGSKIAKSSDLRLKNEVTEIEGSLEKIGAMRGVSFTRKGTDEHEIGVVAQEVEEVFPEVVLTGPDGMKSVDYSSLVAPLIEAVKELKAQNDRQEETIESLRREVQSLRGENSIKTSVR